MKEELNKKHEQERYDFHVNNEEVSDEDLNAKFDNLNVKSEESSTTEKEENSQPVQSSLTKKIKKKAKKALQAQRLQEEAELEAANQIDYLKIETEAIQKLIKSKGLAIKEIPPDGHCLFNSVADQLKINHNQSKSAIELRRICCEELEKNIDNYLPYFTSKTGDIATQEEYLEYCNTMKNTASWGGDLELSALSSTLKLPIQIYQSSGPLVKFGDESKAKPILLSYHKHQYGLGAHYNSLRNE
ncbi:OTU-domain-containing protein [Conidiobolus coronatus NRRL 28638]|uniref:OTU-domain-containing protein n=1 Tax=Conidiobolus coronatus (strain ATCC 28846 / CBS 209.66 / NRRL 28638) TaxID=796925 RepID=A0A137P2R9_CONC2|nr:OTU-domain-containing protein [Conidiobolus coronatus NRRL 28638]|eukprot:KXN69325.1 OTU-domain-containing protein [Conidiobolus coronatus NRRL 28638]